MNTHIPFVVFSAERTGFTADVNAWRTQSAENQLRNMAGSPDFIFVQGKYKDDCETSFLVLLPQGDTSYLFHAIARLAGRWGQESMLYVDANRHASLICLGGVNGQVSSIAYQGKWEQVDRSTAQQCSAYTAYADKYFVTRRHA